MSVTGAVPAYTANEHVGHASTSYERGRPEQSVLYQVLQNHLGTFLQTAAAHDDTTSVPKFVEKELRGLLDCGVLARGLIRLHCDNCKRDIVIGCRAKDADFALAVAVGA